MKKDEVAVLNEDFPSKHFICSFIGLWEQKQVAPYAKFACLDACNLSGKFKGMLICVTNQDSNGTIYIIAHGLVPREDEENWLYFFRHFQNAGLVNSITFLCQTEIKVLLMLWRKCSLTYLIPNACVTCLKTFKKVWPTKCRYFTTNGKILQC